MKKIKLLIASLLIGASAFAQCAASFTYVVNPANNGSVAFTSTSTGVSAYTTYQYSFGDGGYSYWGANPSHQYNTGIYYVCLTITDSMSSCTSTFCDSIQVTNNFPYCNAYFQAWDSLNHSVQIANSSAGSNLIYLWNFGDGDTSNASGSSLTHQYASGGTYIICLTVTNTATTCSSSFCDTVFISSCNASFISTPDTTGNGYTFTSTSAGSANTYYWSFGDGTYSSQQNPYHVYANNGYYYVCLTVSSTIDSSCSDTHCQNVYVTGNCNAYFIATLDSLNTVYISNYSSGNNLTYSWNFGDGTSSSTLPSDSLHQYATGGVYNICLTVTNSVTSCTNTYCQTITISTCTASFTAVTDTSNNICVFTPITSGSPNIYSWTFGDGNTSTQANPTHTYASAGIYYVCLTISSTVDSTCSATYCNYVSVGSYCSATFTVIQDSSNLYNYNVYNNAYANSTINSYLWSFGDGTTSNLPYPQHTYANSTPVQLCLTITTVSGCTSTFCDSIQPGHSVNHTFTINVLDPTASISVINSLEETLSNYPNPFTNSTTISYSLNHTSAVNLFVMDLLGNTVAILENGNKQSGNYTLNFDGSSLSSGIYLLQLRLDDKTMTKKLVIAK